MGKLLVMSSSRLSHKKPHPTKSIFYGFMLLSFFFGAGNLIFPPILGMEAGNHFTPAVLGFIVTATALPMMTLIAIAKSPDGMMGLGRRVHPLFALIFSILIYLSIGTMYGIPRAANVGYEMGFKYMIELPHGIGLMTYVIGFFWGLLFCCSTFWIFSRYYW